MRFALLALLTPLCEPAVHAQLLSDFTPPSGAVPGFPPEEGAWRKRILTATSPDGLDFTRSNRVITDQANVPDLVSDDNGVLYLYYSGGTVGDRRNVIAVAVSSDQGKTWSFKYVEIEGIGRMPSPGDPDVRFLTGGVFRLFFTSAAPGSRTPGIYYADGTDGIHFVFQGPAFTREGDLIIDSFTAPVGDAWHMYTLGDSVANLWHAVSPDGRAFTFHDHPEFVIGGRPYIPTNEIALADGRTRFFAFGPGPQGDIRSFVTSDGYTWEAEPGVRLSLDTSAGLESEFVKDAAVIRLSDGTYLMVYVTLIPL